MAPFRPSGRSNRSGRQTADHDVFEGLPVRQWRQTESTFGLPPPTERPEANDCPFPELPMPRDAHLLASYTQQLLREARKPRFAKRKAEPTEDDKGDDEDEPDKKVIQKGFLARKWTQIPKNSEEPEREYLAKRRKGLPSMFAAAQVAPVVPVTIPTRTAKVRKMDADGNSTIYEVIVPEGQPVEGEVVDEDVAMTEAPKVAPGTVVEGVGIANAQGLVVANDLLQATPQPRKRNGPPRRKKGGPGKGRKRVTFTGPDGKPASAAPRPDGTVTAPASNADGMADTEGAVATNADETTAANGEADDEEGEEGDEGDEDGEDDEDGEQEDPDGTTAPPSTSLAPQETADGAVPASSLSITEIAEPSSETLDPIDSAAPASELGLEQATDDAVPSSSAVPAIDPAATDPTSSTTMEAGGESVVESEIIKRDATSSPDLPLAKSSHSRQASNNVVGEGKDQPAVADREGMEVDPQKELEAAEASEPVIAPEDPVTDETEKTGESEAGDDDLLDRFEKELE